MKYYEGEKTMPEVKEIYDQLVEFTSKVKTTNIADKIVKAAKTGNSSKVKDVFDNFKSEQADLYEKIQTFKKSYEDAGKPTIFARSSDVADGKKTLAYDSGELDPFHLYIFFFVSEILDEDVFEEVLILAEALDETGHPKMADYFYRVVPEYPCYDMLVKIFFKKEEK